MYIRIVILVREEELGAVRAMSEADIRTVREQIRYLLREEARRRGLLACPDTRADRPGRSADASD